LKLVFEYFDHTLLCEERINLWTACRLLHFGVDSWRSNVKVEGGGDDPLGPVFETLRTLNTY